MSKGNSALFFLQSHNEVDQISPILYKLGKRGVLSVDVVLRGDTTSEDYRIKLLQKYDNIIIYGAGYSSKNNKFSKNNIVDGIKRIGQKLPTDIPEKAYKTFFPTTKLQMPHGLDYKNYSVVAFDWSLSKTKATDHLADRDDITTIVLPHGDSPFRNRLETQQAFQRLIDHNEGFEKKIDLSKIGYQSYEDMLKHDYLLFPNNLTASRIQNYCTAEGVKVFGSPRYNKEWLNIISDVRPATDISKTSELHIVLFVRRQDYFVSDIEVENTIRLLGNFSDIQLIVKEHPRDRLLDPSVADEYENVKIVQNEIPSTSLIDWGDAFLSLGTTITFEPIMRRKPVLALEYAHANHTVVSHYFSNADMRCKEDLYNTIHDLLAAGATDFYETDDHRQFVDEMITNSNKSVLDSWAQFIEKITIEKKK